VPASGDFSGTNETNKIKKNTLFEKQSGEVIENIRGLKKQS
jgi:hypothetical protein